MMHLDRFDGLTVFLAVAESGSFAAAGAALGLSRSAVSLSVRKMEDRLGVVLFMRTTRSVGLAEAGKRLFDHARPLLIELDAGLSEAADLGEGPSGTLRISVPRVALETVIEPVLAAFARAAPRVTLEVVADDGLLDIARDGYDAGIRLGDQVEVDMVGINLTGPIPWRIVASPDYIDAHGAPATPADLTNHKCICYRYTSSPRTHRWELLKDGRLTPVTVHGSVVVNDSVAKLAAARQGMGLAYDLAPTFEADIRNGALVSVLENHTQTSAGLFLYFPHRHQVMPKLRTFIDVCKAQFRT